MLRALSFRLPSTFRRYCNVEAVNKDITSVIKCVNFAAERHRDQRRKDPQRTPFINHPIGVAYILTEEGRITDLDVIQAALLHDVAGDTDTSLEEIESLFGENVRKIVAEVTEDKFVPRNIRQKFQIDRAANSSTKAKLVKLADKLHNLRDLERKTPMFWTQCDVDDYFKWAKMVVKGLEGTNKPMEDSLAKIFMKRGL